MKYICVVTFLVLSALSLQAQLIDTIYTEWNIISGFFPRGDSSSIVVTSDGYIHFIDENGSIEQTKRIEPVEEGVVGVHNVFIAFPPASDSFFYVSTFDNHCDYFLNFRLNKLDWNGNLIEYVEFDEWISSDTRFLFPSLPGLPLYMQIGGSYADLIYPEDSIRTLKVDDQLFKMHILDDGSFAFISNDSLYYYSWVQEQPILHNAIKLNVSNPWRIDLYSTGTFDILVKSSNRLSLHSNDLQLLSDTIFPGGETVFFVEMKGDQIFVVSGIEREFTRLHIFSDKLQLMKSFDLPISINWAVGLHLSQDSVLTVAGHESYNGQVAPAFIHQVDLSTTGVSNNTDIAISDMRFIGSDNQTGNCTFVSVREFYFDEVTIQLTNHSAHKIEHVSIIPDKPYCYNWCYIDNVIYFKELENISIDPGESKEFYLGNVRIQKDMPFTDTFVCLTAIFPDNHVDVDHSNNRFCFDFLSGTKNGATPDEFSFFPNPVSDRIYFKSPTAAMAEVSIYDISGHLMKHQTGDFQYLDVAELIPGMYVLRVIGGSEAVMVGKFIKQ